MHHRLSALLSPPDEGSGLYEREGWKVGDRRERPITLTRTSGPSQPMTFALSWEGNDGTFSSPASVVLPLNQPVAVPITVTARKEGAHTAILTLDHPTIPGHAHRVLNTIVVPFQFTSENSHSVKTDVTPPVPGDTSVFVEVPTGVSALTVSTSPGIRLSFVSPTRDLRWRASCPTEPQGGKVNCSVARPSPGVWEINLASQAGRTFDPDATSPLKAKPVTVTATIVDVAVQAMPTSLNATANSARPMSITLQNRLGKVSAEVVSTTLGSALYKRAAIATGEQHVYEIIVPKGTQSLRAAIGEVSDPRADLDLYLLDCTEPEKASDPQQPKELEKGNKAPSAPDPLCGPRAKLDGVETDGEVEVAYPAPGRWVVVVDAYAVPGGRTDYRYLDAFTHPRFGTLAVADVGAERPSSTTWTAKANAWMADLPAAPRQIQVRVLVTSGAITQPVRTQEGYDLSGVRTWPVPIGTLDLKAADAQPTGSAGRPVRRGQRPRVLDVADLGRPNGNPVTTIRRFVSDREAMLGSTADLSQTTRSMLGWRSLFIASS